MNPEFRAEVEALAQEALAEAAEVPRVEVLTPLEEPDRGYCTPCQLPSVLSWQVAFEVAADFTIRTVSVCTECGEESWDT